MSPKEMSSLPDVHDTTLIDRALAMRERAADAAVERLTAVDRRLEAALSSESRRKASVAHGEVLISGGKFALMAAVAAAIVLLAAGYAWQIANPERAAPPASAAEPVARAMSSAATAIPPERDDIIVSNYVIFTESTRTVGGREYVVQAGHRYPDERAPSYERAWCYIQETVGGMTYSLDLGHRTPEAPAVPGEAGATAAALGLNEAEMTQLFRACPWLQTNASGAAAMRGTGTM